MSHGAQAMHFMLPGKGGLAPLLRDEDDTVAFEARLDAMRVRYLSVRGPHTNRTHTMRDSAGSAQQWLPALAC